MPTPDGSTVTLDYIGDAWVAVDAEYPTLSGIGETRTEAYKMLVTALRLALQVQESEIERLQAGLEHIEQWTVAYPETVFRPVTPEQMLQASRVLHEAGISMDAMHAGWARHILDGIREIVRAALADGGTNEQS